MKKGNKIYCDNCGTKVSATDKACPVCHIAIKKNEKLEQSDANKTNIEETEVFELKKEIPFEKILMIVLIFIGIILTVKGFVEYQNISACTADNCGFKELFLAGFGIILLISAGIALARSKSVYKKN